MLGGLVLGAVVYAALPDRFVGTTGDVVELGHAGRSTAALAAVMAVWWMTEAIEISATALLPVAALPLLGAANAEEAAAPYANPLIFLFLGGFLLVLAMRRWGLERRIALIALRLVGTEPRRVVGGFMVLTAVLSMWVSNTATVAMMLPIALSIIDAAVAASLAFMLPVATPPNAIVFGTGLVTIPQMMRVGLRLNIASIVIITVMVYAVGAPLFGFDLPVR